MDIFKTWLPYFKLKIKLKTLEYSPVPIIIIWLSSILRISSTHYNLYLRIEFDKVYHVALAVRLDNLKNTSFVNHWKRAAFHIAVYLIHVRRVITPNACASTTLALMLSPYKRVNCWHDLCNILSHLFLLNLIPLDFWDSGVINLSQAPS